MKIMQKLKTIILFAIIANFTLSCTDEVSTAPSPDNTITGLAVATPNLSILVQALTKANLSSTLRGTGPFTVFAPTNAAFTAFLQVYGFANLDAVPVATLKEILLNHVVSGAVQSTALTTGYIKTLGKGAASSTNTLSMFVNTMGGVRLNGVSSVTTPNIIASNGVIHIVDSVIGLPTIVTHATANTAAFSTLVSLLDRSTMGQPNFVTILGGAGPFTVFAPTNTAFTNLNTELAPGGTASVSPANITKVLQYHVAGGNLLAASLTTGQVVTTFAPLTVSTFQTFAVNLTPARITDVRARVSNITVTDVQCANGVIHVLDRVLLPTF